MLLAVCLATGDEETKRKDPKDEVQASGWLQINERWPIGGKKSHFYLVKKGHHFIEIKVPKSLDQDFRVRLEYYFNQANVRPALQFVPCSGSAVSIISDEPQTNGSLPEALKPGWHNHTWTVDHSRCKQRNLLTYNIILHDENDVFAWSSLEIESIPPRPQTTTTTTTTPATTTQPPTTPAATTKTPTIASMTTTTKPTTTTAKPSTSRARSLDIPTTESGDEDEDVDLGAPNMYGVFEDDEEQRRGAKKRLKREDTAHEPWALICTVEQCNRTLVEFPDFKTVIGGFEELYESALADPRYRFFVNTNNDPLRLVVEAPDRDLTEVDVCLEFQLFMDANTYISLRLNDTQLNDGQKLLETFETTPDHWAAGGWQTIKRCLSDYTPKLTAADHQSKKEAGIHRLQLSLIPRVEQPSREKIMVKFVDGLSRSFRELVKPLKYLPNAVNCNGTDEVEKMWIIDKWIVRTAEFRLMSSNESDQQQASKRNGPRSQVLLVDKIEPSLQHFDLTSRWIQIDELDLLDNSTMFSYKLADKPNWIKSIEFGFQRDDLSPKDGWNTELIYTGREAAVASANKTTEDEMFSKSIKLKSIKSGKAFRLRLRHHVDTSLAPKVNSHKLIIQRLAMGDACTLDQQQTVCLNGGQCEPIGISQVKCTCLRGYSGKHCEQMRPCEVVHAGALSGADFCQSVGAKCVENIPVLRCHWPDDRYYQCRVLNGTSGEPELTSEPPEIISTSANSSGDESDETTTRSKEQQLENRIRRQNRLIFILSILLASTVFIGLMSIVNLSARLRKSRNRLETAQVGVHELTRQFRPNTSSRLNLTSDIDDDASTSSKRRTFDTSNSFKSYSNRGFDSTS